MHIAERRLSETHLYCFAPPTSQTFISTLFWVTVFTSRPIVGTVWVLGVAPSDDIRTESRVDLPEFSRPIREIEIFFF